MKITRPVLTILVALTLFAVALPAAAHNWGCWIQPNRTVYVRNTASYSSQAAAALNEWHNDTVLNIVNVSYHTEVSVYDGNYGNTGWGGLASIESYSGCNILHGHARVNYYYSYTSNGIRGVFCQEVGHLFGLDHSNDGGCMGGGYFYSIDSNYNVVSHNISDISSKYSGVPYFTTDPDKHGDDHPPQGDGPAVHAVWYHHPTSLREVTGLASAVVKATVTGVYDAADIVMPIVDDEVDRIPTQRIGFQVEQVFQGRIEKEFDLFHTGNENFVLDGDPSYELGETYVLFLMPRDDGSYLVVSPEGRYLVNDEQGLVPMSQESFSQVLGDLKVDDLDRDLKEMGRPNTGR